MIARSNVFYHNWESGKNIVSVTKGIIKTHVVARRYKNYSERKTKRLKNSTFKKWKQCQS